MHLCAINSYVCFLYLTPFFWVYIEGKNIHFYNINKILFHQKPIMTHSCNAPIRTIRHVKRMKTIKKQHSGKMKSNHHLPEFDSVFFSSEKKKSDSEFIFFLFRIHFTFSSKYCHKGSRGTGATISSISFLTGCTNRTRLACREMEDTLLLLPKPYFKSPFIGQPMWAN